MERVSKEDTTELIETEPTRQGYTVTIDTIRIGHSEDKISTTNENCGATFDSTISLHGHVSSLVKSCNSEMRSFYHARKYLMTDATKNVLHEFISSRLHNGNSLLYGLPDHQIKQVQRIQNTAHRILTRTKKF